MTVEKFEPDEAWVPADRRWLGLDRRTIAPTMVVFALALLMAVVLPLADTMVHNDDAATAGDVIEVSGGVTFLPEPGWEIISGVRAGDRPTGAEYPPTALVADGDVIFSVRASDFDGDVYALLDQIESNAEGTDGDGVVQLTGSPSPITTDDGETGIVTRLAGPQTSGMVAVFTFDGLGVAVVATGPADLHGFPEEEVLRMIASIRHDAYGRDS